MKNNRSRKTASGKTLAIASVIGVAAVGAAVLAAYNTTMSRLIPTNATLDGTDGNTSTWVFEDTEESAEPAAPVGNSVSGVPLEDEEPSDGDLPAIAPSATGEAEPPAEEVNKPVVSDMGNIMPVEGEVSHPFSNGELVKSETLGVWKTHDGCDILCPLETDVKSMSEGTVKEITEDPLWGVCVVVNQSNGLEVHYCGLSKELNVKAGSQVKQGEIIGKTSDTCQIEIVQQPHLHLGVKQNGKWIDPTSVISSE